MKTIPLNYTPGHQFLVKLDLSPGEISGKLAGTNQRSRTSAANITSPRAPFK